MPNPHQFSYDPKNKVCYRTLDFMGFPGYRVGDDGSVWSAWVSAGRDCGKGFRHIGTAWKKRNLELVWTGYFRILIQPGRKRMPVHRLVLLAFVGPRPEAHECRHLNGKRDDNRLANLTWGTKTENDADKDRHGTRLLGERNSSSKLSKAQVLSIRSRYAAGGVTQKQLAAQHRVRQTTISMIVTRAVWRHVP